MSNYGRCAPRKLSHEVDVRLADGSPLCRHSLASLACTRDVRFASGRATDHTLHVFRAGDSTHLVIFVEAIMLS